MTAPDLTSSKVPDANATFRAKQDGEVASDNDRPFHCPGCAAPYYASPVNKDVRKGATLNFMFRCALCEHETGMGLG